MKASECNCCKCGKQAVAFWPITDPDIPSYPYCRECLDKEKKSLLIKLFGKEKGELLAEMEKQNRIYETNDINHTALGCSGQSRADDSGGESGDSQARSSTS